jgi:hypothetical protein
MLRHLRTFLAGDMGLGLVINWRTADLAIEGRMS